MSVSKPLSPQVGDQSWLHRALFGLGALLLLAALWWLIGQFSSSGGSGKAKPPVAKVSLLPDTPPPPPKEEPKKEQPKEEPKQTVQLNKPEPTPQQTPPPGPPQTKVDEAAGDGPSSLGPSGKVTNDGVPGGVGGGVATAPVDRQAFRLYARSLQGRLQADLERQLSSSDMPKLVVTMALWMEPGGSCSRYELNGSSRPDFDKQTRSALEKACASLHQAAPPGMPQPIRMQLTIVPQGS